MTHVRVELPVSRCALSRVSPRELLAYAHAGLADAATTATDNLRYGMAHLAAVRTAAAVLAARATYSLGIRRRPVSVWDLLPQVDPDLAVWADYFKGRLELRAVVEAGIPHAVTAAEADEAVCAAGDFVAFVEIRLDLRPQ